jgi:hypothetical protein
MLSRLDIHSVCTIERTNKMELDRALELAVESSWEELVTPDERCSMHIEYENIAELELSSLEVWMIKNHGYGKLVCSYSVSRSDSSATSLEPVGIHFENPYRSKTLAGNLGFIMRNQRQFSRPPDRSIHGLVQIDRPSEAERNSAAIWSRGICTDSTEHLAAETLPREAIRV